MPSLLTATVLLAFTLLGSATEGSSRPGDAGHLKADLDAVVATERAFETISAQKGIRQALLDHLSIRSVVFRPQPQDGRAWYLSQKDLEGRLAWEPLYAEISAGGDLAYTTGVWVHRTGGEGAEPSAWGHYVSIWQAQPDGRFYLLVSVGNRLAGRPGPASEAVTVGEPVMRVPPDRVPEAGLAGIDAAAAKADLMATERAYSNLSSFKGSAEAARRHAAADIRFYAAGSAPLLGVDAHSGALAARPGTLTWRAIASLVARSADLGLSVGSAQLETVAASPKAPERWTYLRLWRRQAGDAWKVALEMVDPVPQPALEPSGPP